MKYLIEITDEIENFNEYVTVTKKKGDIVEGIYKTTFDDFLNVLNNSVELNDEMLETPVLPDNCIKFVWKNLKRNIAEVYIVVPKCRRDITFYGNSIKQVGFPKMIFKYSVQDYNVTLSNILAIKNDEPIRINMPVYHFPFSHVSSQGTVCMGGNSFPRIERIQQLESFHNLFLSSPFSSDYGAKTITGKTVNQLFDELSNIDFNDDWLLPITSRENGIHTQATIGDYYKLQTI